MIIICDNLWTKKAVDFRAKIKLGIKSVEK